MKDERPGCRVGGFGTGCFIGAGCWTGSGALGIGASEGRRGMGAKDCVWVGDEMGLDRIVADPVCDRRYGRSYFRA